MYCLPIHSTLKEEISAGRNVHEFSKFDTNS